MSDQPSLPRQQTTVEYPKMRVVYTGWFNRHERRVKREALERWDARKARGTLRGKRWWQPFNARWTGRSALSHKLIGLAVIVAVSLTLAALLTP